MPLQQPPASRGKILNVDDTDVARYAVTRMLQHAGFDVLEAATGQQCLERAHELQPDLIVLDVQLPDISGFEVCRRLKRDPATAHIAVLHMSASFVGSQDKAYGLEGGADGYLTQPVEPEELVAHIDALLRMRRAEEAARALARQWQTTFDALSEGICLLDGEGRIRRINRALERMLNRPQDQLMGACLEEIAAEILGPVQTADFIVATRHLTRTTMEVTVDGRSIRIAFDPVMNDAGEREGTVAVFSDVTQHKRIDAALRESDQRFRLLTENVKDYVILMLDPEGRIVVGNAGVARILGYEDEEILGQPGSLIFTEEDRAARVPEQEMDKARVIGHSEDVRWHVRKDGSMFWADGVMTSLRDDEGNLRGYAKILRDATEQKHAEEERQSELEKQSHIAETLQRSLLLAVPPDTFPGLSLYTVYEAALDEAMVGGDFYDAFALEGGKIALVVGDVSGKGLAAASRTAEVKYAFRALLHEFPAPAEALVRLNHFVFDSYRLGPTTDETFIVMAVVVLDTATGEAEFSAAGAEPPLVLRADGRVESVPVIGWPLGIEAHAAYERARRALAPDDMILMATDGITEARRGREFLGWEGLARFAGQIRASVSLDHMGRMLLTQVKAFAGGSLRDDACLLLARRTDPRTD